MPCFYLFFIFIVILYLVRRCNFLWYDKMASLCSTCFYMPRRVLYPTFSRASRPLCLTCSRASCFLLFVFACHTCFVSYLLSNITCSCFSCFRITSLRTLVLLAPHLIKVSHAQHTLMLLMSRRSLLSFRLCFCFSAIWVFF